LLLFLKVSQCSWLKDCSLAASTVGAAAAASSPTGPDDHDACWSYTACHACHELVLRCSHFTCSWQVFRCQL
jgi:hypothetical protein